nr:murein L,D-transpeptidase catalytic domain family protein [Allomuricauda sp.]
MSYKIIKAALNGQKGYQGKCYLFNGQKYVRYNWARDKPDKDYPKNLSLWKLKGDFSKGIDAAINGRCQFEGFGYLFKGDKYVKYDWEQDCPVGRPRSLKIWGLKESFSKNIDAACNGKGIYSNFGYLFKGKKYIKYDWKKDAPSDGKLRDISLWNFPTEFLSGVDAAMDGDGPFSNYTYFFKNNKYVRYDWKTYTCHGPFSIRKDWRIENTLEYEVKRLYKNFGLKDKIDFKAFRLAYLGQEYIGKKCNTYHLPSKVELGEGLANLGDFMSNYLGIIDLTKPSNEPRFTVLHLPSLKVKNYIRAFHGIGASGLTKESRRYVRRFSNSRTDNKACFGFFVAGRTYATKHGEDRAYLKLYGIERWLNDKAHDKDFIIHTVVSDMEKSGYHNDTHRASMAIDVKGSEWVNGQWTNPILEKLKEGSLIFIYAPPKHAVFENGVDYFKNSEMSSCLEELARHSFGALRRD